MTRTKTDIIDDIHERLANRYTKREVADIVESVFDIIKETAQREGKVMISGFGFSPPETKGPEEVETRRRETEWRSAPEEF